MAKIIQQTQITFKQKDKESIYIDVPYLLPYEKGMSFYYSARDFEPAQEEAAKKLMEQQFPGNTQKAKNLKESFIQTIKNECDEFHIKNFVVTNVVYSQKKSYLNYPDDITYTTTKIIEVKESRVFKLINSFHRAIQHFIYNATFNKN